MAFQFTCPQGHLLEADPSQMGATVACPTCGATFTVPNVHLPAATPMALPVAPVARPVAPPDASPPVAQAVPADAVPAPAPFDPFNSPAESPVSAGGGVETFLPHVGGGGGETRERRERILHVPCPNDHILQTPEDMMGQTVMCPHCGEMFELRYRDSMESRREKKLAEERRVRKSGKLWLNWAIAIAILVVAGIIAMIVSIANYER